MSERVDHPEWIPPKNRNVANGLAVRVETAEIRQRVLGYLEQGLTVRSAMAKVDRAEETYKFWRKSVDGFAVLADRARARAAGTWEPPAHLSFEEWRTEFMHLETFPHQRQWIDVLEDREPAGLHEASTFLRGRHQRVIINTPPFHAKSSTITIDYVTYRICMDPNVRVIIISESRDMARKMLHAIKDRLTHPRYEAMHQAYGPAGGFKVGAASWTQDLIYVGNRDSVEKDPTVEVLGIGSQIYGARADLIIMDDCVTLKTGRTAGQREKIVSFIDQDVSSRLDSKNGKLLLVGTRVSPNDVYAALLKRDREKPEGRRVWTYLAQPAVLEYADDEAEWETLWPFLWDGEALSLRRDEIDAATWNLVYQQQQVAEDAVFPEEAVTRCRYMGSVGPLPVDGVRARGMEGLYVVAGLDPATAGYTGIVVLGVDKRTGMRYVLDVVNHRGMTPGRLRQVVSGLQSKYRVNEWRIEKNATQSMISQDPELRKIVHNGGGRIVEHFTGNNKWDAEFGVMSLAGLFLGSLENPQTHQILIPDNSRHKGVNALIDQLIAYDPEGAGKTDVVMALWFADLGARQVLKAGSMSTHVKGNPWLSRSQRASQVSVKLSDLIEQQREGIVYA